MLLGKGLTDRQHPLLRTGPIRGLTVAPGRGLGVQIIQILPGPSGEKRIANVTDGPFHATLLVAARDRDRPRLEAIMAGELQEERIEADRIPLTFQDSTLKIVIENDPHTPRQAANAAS